MKTRMDLLPDITMGSIHKINNRTLVVVGLWWNQDRIDQVDFYEPVTDKINQCTFSEVSDWVQTKALKLHQPDKGRTLKRK
jgi:hypothetical protein